MAQALQHVDIEGQLALYDMPRRAAGLRARVGDPGSQARQRPLCAWCQAKEARYGFRAEGTEATSLDRPRTLCFECFRSEIDRRRTVAERMARGWNAQQVGLPLEETLNELTRRRRRAQIAARHALELS